MLEIHTKPISREYLDKIILRCRAIKSFKPSRAREAPITLEREVLRDLSRYTIADFPGIILECRRPMAPGQAELAGELIASVADLCSTVSLGFEIAESGRAYDPNEEPDLTVAFGTNYVGPMAQIMVGTASPGRCDLAYRARLFNRFVNALGLGRSVTAAVARGNLRVDRLDPEIKFYTDLPRAELARAFASGTRLIGLGSSDLAGLNPMDLTFNCFPRDELIGRIPGVLETYDHQRIHFLDATLGCPRSTYDRCRALLNLRFLNRWRVSFIMRTPYNLDQLDAAERESEAFLIEAFSLKLPGIGSVVVTLDYDHGSYHLCFAASDTFGDLHEARLERMINEFAGSDDIIDRTPT
jgi:hypothetical protein